MELRLFRLVAIGEALSWAGLPVGMFFKYILVTGEACGVPPFASVRAAHVPAGGGGRPRSRLTCDELHPPALNL
ncbi:hypothetical protein [Nonomuraea sp. 10N515B]|uniref:hypothetical protein n=1 Tax=Nonomuraea sp. 10N515B TaxID=3457422 RepID=UPI003FCCFA17